MRWRGYRNSTLTDSQYLSIDLIDLNDTYKVRSLRIAIAGHAFSCSMHVIEIKLTAKAIKARPNRAWSFALPPLQQHLSSLRLHAVPELIEIPGIKKNNDAHRPQLPHLKVPGVRIVIRFGVFAVAFASKKIRTVSLSA
jgi:hypothetical protein